MCPGRYSMSLSRCRPPAAAAIVTRLVPRISLKTSWVISMVDDSVRSCAVRSQRVGCDAPMRTGGRENNACGLREMLRLRALGLSQTSWPSADRC